jgi:hypothetical protein
MTSGRPSTDDESRILDALTDEPAEMDNRDETMGPISAPTSSR